MLDDADKNIQKDWWVHWTKEGVEIDQNVPLFVIRPSRTPKTNLKKNCCSKSLPSMGANVFHIYAQNKKFIKPNPSR